MAGPRDTIKARIALDGGAEIRRELEELGAVGEAAWRRLQRAAEAFKGPDNTAVGRIKEIQATLDQAAQKFTSVGLALGKIGAGIGLTLSAPIIAFGKDTLSVAGSFEQAMNDIQASARASGTEMEALKAKTLELSEKFSLAPVDIAHGLEELAKAGVTVKETLTGAGDAVALLARANKAEFLPAATAVSDMLRQFKINASEVGPVVDQITAALNLSKGNFQQFQQALAQSGSEAARMGISTKEFLTTLALTAPAFAAGSDGGTSYKRMLQQLIPTTEAAKEIFKEIGFSAIDPATGKFKNLTRQLNELREGFNKFSLEDRSAKLFKAFGTDAIRTIDFLLKQNAGTIETWLAEVDKIKAVDVAADRMKGWKFETERFSAALDRLKIAIGDAGLLKWATDLVAGLANLITSLRTTNPEILKWATIIGTVVAAIGPLTFYLGTLVWSFGQILVPVRAAIGMLEGFATASKAVKAADAAKAITEVGAAAVSASAKAVPALEAIPAAVAAAGAKSKDAMQALPAAAAAASAKTAEAFKAIPAAASAAWSAAATAIAGSMGPIANQMVKLPKQIEDAWVSTAKTTGNLAATALASSAGQIAEHVKQIPVAFQAAMQTAATVAGRETQNIATRATTGIKGIEAALKPLPAALQAAMTGAAQIAGRETQSIVQSFRAITPELQAAMADVAATFGAQLVPIKTELKAIPPAVQAAWKGAADISGRETQAIAQSFKKLPAEMLSSMALAATQVGAALTPIRSELKLLPAETSQAWKKSIGDITREVPAMGKVVAQASADALSIWTANFAQFGKGLGPANLELEKLPKTATASMLKVEAATGASVTKIVGEFGKIPSGITAAFTRAGPEAAIALATVVGSNKVAVDKVALFWSGLGATIRAAFTEIGASAAVLVPFINPIGAAIIAVTATVVTLWAEWDNLKKGFEEGVDLRGVTHEVEGFWQNVGKGAKVAQNEWKVFWEELKAATRENNVHFSESFRHLMEELRDIGKDGGREFGKRFAEGAKTEVEQFVTDIKNIFSGLRDFLGRSEEIREAMKQGIGNAVADELVRAAAEFNGFVDNVVKGAGVIKSAFVDTTDGFGAWGPSLATSMTLIERNLAKGKFFFGELGSSSKLQAQVSERAWVEAAARIESALLMDLDRVNSQLKNVGANTAAAAAQAVTAVERMITVWDGATGKTKEYEFHSQKALDKMNPAPVEKNGERVIRVWHNISEATRKAIEEESKLGKTAEDRAKRLADGLAKAGDGIKEYRDKLVEANQALPNSAEAAGGQSVEQILKWGRIGVNEFGQVIEGMRFEPVVKKAAQAGEEIKKGVLDPIKGLPAAIDLALSSRIDFKEVKDPLKEIPETAKTAVDETTKELGRVADATTKAMEPVQTKAQEIGTAASTAFITAFTAIQGTVTRVVDGLITDLSKLITKIDELKGKLAGLGGETAGPEPLASPESAAAANAASAGPFASLVEAADAAFKDIIAKADATRQVLLNAFTGLTIDWSTLTSGAATAFSEMLTVIEQVLVKLDELRSKIANIGGDAPAVQTEAASPESAAAGNASASGPFARLVAEADTAFQEIIAKADAARVVITNAFTGINVDWTPLTIGAVTAFAQMLVVLNQVIAKVDELKAKIATIGQTQAAPAAPIASPESAAAGNATAAGPFAALVTAADTAFQDIVSKADAAKATVQKTFTDLTVDWSAFVTGASQAFDGIKTEAERAKADALTVFEELVDEAVKILMSIGKQLGQLKTEMVKPFLELEGEVNSVFERIVQAIGVQMGQAVQAFSGPVHEMISLMHELETAADAAAAAVSSASSGGGDGGEENARGGMIHGPGTSTSDSIPAWLSKGEYVVRARAVRKYGSRLLAAINAGRFKMPKLARGGPVAAPTMKLGLPAFSGGGLADLARDMLAMPQAPRLHTVETNHVSPENLRPVHVHLDNQEVALMGSQDAVDQIMGAARMQRLTKAGRAPSWKGAR